MDIGLAAAVGLALAFAVTNGLHDASNSIATLVATRVATPRQAIVLASVFNLLGPFVVGAAVADTIGGIVTVDSSVFTEVTAAGLAAAVTWNLVTWRLGLPSSSGHALVGGLVGAALLEGGTAAVNWGGFDGLHPVGVIGTSRRARRFPAPRRSRGAAADPGAAAGRTARHATLARLRSMAVSG